MLLSKMKRLTETFNEEIKREIGNDMINVVGTGSREEILKLGRATNFIIDVEDLLENAAEVTDKLVEDMEELKERNNFLIKQNEELKALLKELSKA